MDFERQNKLPEGVGKRIIEVLKTNREQEDVSGFEANSQNNYIKNPSYNNYQEPEYKDYNHNYESNSQNNYSSREEYRDREQKINNNNKETFGSSNIDTLVELVTTLPPGVTKQTGAQIIRHTMEAMGIQMNQVLSKAQMVQEGLEQGIKNNINIIVCVARNFPL